MGVRIPPPLPHMRSDGFHRAGAGVLSGGVSRVQTGDVAQSPGAREFHGGRHRGDRGARVLPGSRGHRARAGGGKDSSMSSQETARHPKQWFVVHTYSGFEDKVASAIESRAKIFGLSEQI